ncbi:MAG: hypothetical protein ACK417_03155 [Bacteroidia bacterium]
MKKLLISLIFCLSLSTAMAGGELTAESASVKKMFHTIQDELRIPAKVFDFCEGERPEVHFTIDSQGYIKVLEVVTSSPFLEKQLRRSFEKIRTFDANALSGQRFSLTLNLNR